MNRRKIIRMLLGLFLMSINLIIFQNFSPSQVEKTKIEYSALAFVERTLIELNRVTGQPLANALILAYSTGITMISAVMLGDDKTVFYAANIAQFSINKYRHYSKYEKLSEQELQFINSLETQIKPYLKTPTLGNRSFKLYLTEATTLVATEGKIQIMSYNEYEEPLYSWTITRDNLNYVSKIVAEYFKAYENQKMPTPFWITLAGDDPSDFYDSLSEIPDIIVNELNDNSTISESSLLSHNLMESTDYPSFRDAMPLGFTDLGVPYFSKVTYEIRSSFDPDLYKPPANGGSGFITTPDPYDSTNIYDYYSGVGVGDTGGGINPPSPSPAPSPSPGPSPSPSPTPPPDYLDHDIPPEGYPSPSPSPSPDPSPSPSPDPSPSPSPSPSGGDGSD